MKPCQTQERNWRRGSEANHIPSKLNVKTWPLPSLKFGFSFLLVCSRLLFFAFFGVFFGDLGFNVAIHMRIHHHFSSFFWVLTSGPTAVANGPLSAKCFPWLKPLVTPLVRQTIIFQSWRLIYKFSLNNIMESARNKALVTNQSIRKWLQIDFMLVFFKILGRSLVYL